MIGPGIWKALAAAIVLAGTAAFAADAQPVVTFQQERAR